MKEKPVKVEVKPVQVAEAKPTPQVHEKLRDLGIDYGRPIRAIDFNDAGNVTRIEFDDWPKEPVVYLRHVFKLRPRRLVPSG